MGPGGGRADEEWKVAAAARAFGVEHDDARPSGAGAGAGGDGVELFGEEVENDCISTDCAEAC